MEIFHSEYIPVNWAFALFAVCSCWCRLAVSLVCRALACVRWAAWRFSRTKPWMYAGGYVWSPLAISKAKSHVNCCTNAAELRVSYLSLSCCLKIKKRSRNQQRVAKTSGTSSEVPKPKIPHHNSHFCNADHRKPAISRCETYTASKPIIWSFLIRLTLPQSMQSKAWISQFQAYAASTHITLEPPNTMCTPAE